MARKDGVNIWSDLIDTERAEDGVYMADVRSTAKGSLAFLPAYEALRIREGRHDLNEVEVSVLPEVPEDHPHRSEWRQRARSLKWLLSFLGDSEKLKVIDAGAGNCWLCRHLLERGHSVCAVDLTLSRGDGLQAGARLESDWPDRFARLHSSYDAIPIADDSVDLILFNGSLHYTQTIGTTLKEADRLLADQGRVIIMDSPLYRTDWSGQRMVEERGGPEGARYLHRPGLVDDANRIGYSTTFYRRDSGPVALLRRLYHTLRLRREPAAMPWIVLEKPP